MGIIRRSAKGTLAVGTRPRSVTAETRIKATPASVGDLSNGERAAGILFKGTSHDEGHDAHVTLYADRIERVQDDSSLSIPRPADVIELTSISSVSSVETKKQGFSYTRASVYTTGSPVDFMFRNKAAGLFRDAVHDLILAKGRTIQTAPAKEVLDLSGQLRELTAVRNAEIRAIEEFDVTSRGLRAEPGSVAQQAAVSSISPFRT